MLSRSVAAYENPTKVVSILTIWTFRVDLYPKPDSGPCIIIQIYYLDESRCPYGWHRFSSCVQMLPVSRMDHLMHLLPC